MGQENDGGARHAGAGRGHARRGSRSPGALRQERPNASTTSPTRRWPGASEASSTSRPPRCTPTASRLRGATPSARWWSVSATGRASSIPLIFPMLGTALWVRGRITEAGRDLRRRSRGLRMQDELPGTRLASLQPLVPWPASPESAELSTRDCAREHRDRDAPRRQPRHGSTAWALAMALLETGEAQQAADLLIASTGGAELRLSARRLAGLWSRLLTRCFLGAGRLVEAEAAVAAAAAHAGAISLPMAAGWATRAAAELGARTRRYGRWSSRSRHRPPRWRSRIPAAFSTRPSPARSPGGRWCAAGERGSRRDGARRRRRRRARTFGSARYGTRAERELRRLGRGIHRRTRPGKADGLGVAVADRA